MKENKIGIFGLSNAGKTSLIKSLMRQFDEISDLKPTKGSERTLFYFMGKEIFFWDFGGQERYRAKYLNNPTHYFDSFNYVYFVIDIQDLELLDMNILYFKLIVRELKTFSPNAEYIILYHKADHEFIQNKMPDIREDFFNRILPFLEDNDIKPEIFQTTIFDPFSVIVAFSRPFLKKINLYENITDIMVDFGTKNGLIFCVLFTPAFFEIGHFKDDKISDKLFSDILRIFLSKYEPEMGNPDMYLDDQKIDIMISTIEINLGNELLVFYPIFAIEDEKIKDDKTKKIELAENITQLNNDLQKLLMTIDLSRFLD